MPLAPLSRSRRLVVAGLLIAGTLVRCDCEEQKFQAAATYTPPQSLDFGAVAVSTQRTLPIVVRNEGSAGLRLVAVNLENDASNGTKFLVKVDEALTTGVTPSRTASITVTYRPCPDAWTTVTINGEQVDQLKTGFDYNTCPQSSADGAELVTVEFDTLDGGTRINLSGQPVQPPSIELACQTGSAACNMPAGMLQTCTFMNFGNAVFGESQCELVVELRNKYRGTRPVGELEIQGLDITLQRLNPSPLPTTPGREVGFTLHELDGTEILPSSDQPIRVPAPAGTDPFGSKKVKLRFTGAAGGDWFGNEAFGMTGVRLYTNDPDNAVVKFGLSGTGSKPDIGVQPPVLNFGPVEQGRTKTLTATVTNSGTADLIISSITFANDTAGARFTYDTDKGAPPFTVAQNGATAHIHVHYTPPTPGQDADTLRIGNNDLKTMGVVEVPITGGAVPQISVEPPDTLVFPLPNPIPPPPVPPNTQTITISNVGFGDLDLTRLQITGPGGDPAHPSVDDFRIMESGGQNPWDANVRLCPPSNPTCTTSSRVFHIVYQNNDISSVDLAELHIRSTDPTDMDHVVVLNAADVPCLFPTPVITVITPRPCKGMPVEVDASTSTPGGDGVTTTITSYDWFWSFAVPPPVFTANGMGAVRTTFTPADSGLFILGLDVTNDCGQRSQNAASESVNVSDTCQ